MSSGTLTTAGLGGMEQRGLAGGRVMMDDRRMVALSGVVVASTTARPGKVDATLHHSRWIGGRWLRRPHTRQASWFRSTPDWWVPIPGRRPGWDLRS